MDKISDFIFISHKRGDIQFKQQKSLNLCIPSSGILTFNRRRTVFFLI